MQAGTQCVRQPGAVAVFVDHHEHPRAGTSRPSPSIGRLQEHGTSRAVTCALASALACGLFSGTALAQESEEPSLEEVRVTGTRIQHTGMTTPTPVASLSVNELSDMAPASVAEGLSQLPQFYGNQTPATFGAAGNNFFTSSGGGSLNLRGVGTRRTLTLLDGRRVAPSTIYGGPDINLFPEAILRNVETVTGGASAAYGTDAVSGVVNFVLDTGFTGFRSHVQTGATSRGDGDNSEVSISAGRQIGERLHVLFSAEHAEQDAIDTWADRGWYQGWGLVRNTDASAGSSRDNPFFIPASQITSLAASYDGVITAWQPTPGNTVPASFGRMQFNSDGTASPFVLGSLVSTVNNAQSTVGGGSGTDNNTDRPNVLPGATRTNAFTYLDFKLNDDTQLFVQGLYGKQSLRSTNAGGLLQAGSGQPVTIFADNAFLPDALRQAMADNNIASFTMGRIGHSADIAGSAFVQQDTQTVSGTVGFKSAFSGGRFDGWSLDGYYQYGRTNVNASQKGGIRIDRLSLALDAVTDPATGNTVCHVTLISGLYPDCVPLNLFGRGNASQEAIDWVTGFDPGVAVITAPYLPGEPATTYSYVGGEDKQRLIDLKQHVAELVASGEVWDGFGAGAVSLALGAHYRRETVAQNVRASQGNPAADPFVFPVPANDAALGIRGTPPGAANNSVEIQFSKVPFIRGAYDVYELFSETLVPLLNDKPYLEQLNFNGAVRWADYGGSGTIWSYKGGLDAKIGPQVRLRGTYSRDVRAANLGERFDRTGGTANVTDYGLAGPPPPYQITIVQGGNPEVDPEKADTFTAGFVYRPLWLPGLDMSVDWLQVSLEGAIESFTAQQIVDACYRQGNTDQCAFIERGPDGRIFIVNQSAQNVSSAKISGIDAELGYTRAIDLFGGSEQIATRLFASWLSENSITSSNGVKLDRAGETGVRPGDTSVYPYPELKLTGNITYSNGPLRTFLQARYIDGGLLSASNNLNGVFDVADNTVSSVTYVDLHMGYTMDLGGGTGEVFASVTNLFDRDPPVVPSYSVFTAAPTQTNPLLFDQLGRRFTVGIRLDFQ